MSEQSEPLVGHVIRGYSLDRLLGRGTLTAVYHGRTQEKWQLPELIITLLLLPAELTGQQRKQFIMRFEQEARRLVTLRHPHLLPLYGFGEYTSYPYILTPNIDGEGLAARLREKQRWSPAQALSIITPLAMALDYLHAQGVVCQYFNPSNVIIQRDNTVMLTGMRLMHILSAHNHAPASRTNPFPHLHSIAGSYLGAAQYLAPEVIQNTRVDQRADIYSLGILLFELLSGQPPFLGDSYAETAYKHIHEPLPSLHEVCPDLPKRLEIIVNNALHRNPERRYQKASELVHAYSQLLNDFQQTPKILAMRRTVEQIRALPSPSPELKLMLPSPSARQGSSWPYAILPEMPAQYPQLPPGVSQQTAEYMKAQLPPGPLPEPVEETAEPIEKKDNLEETDKRPAIRVDPNATKTNGRYPIQQYSGVKQPGDNTQPTVDAKRQEIDKMARELRLSRERLQKRANEQAEE